MKDEEIKKLLEKYEAGDSTLDEERFLCDNAEKSPPTSKEWLSFVSQNRKNAPENFNETLWDSFQDRTSRKRRFKIGIISAAASIILIIAFFIGNMNQRTLSYAEKEALLNQALEMFVDSEQKVMNEKIIYEDKMIIIYANLE